MEGQETVNGVETQEQVQRGGIHFNEAEMRLRIAYANGSYTETSDPTPVLLFCILNRLDTMLGMMNAQMQMSHMMQMAGQPAG